MIARHGYSRVSYISRYLFNCTNASSIYERIGPPRRVSLAKLTAESLREKNRPLRIAVDFAIWEFQHQAARGGTNAAIRTLFYRLARLLGTPIQPIFVFDGPHKPPFKRGKNSARGSNTTISQAQAKTLIRLFGFPVHDAPGEGEAECALLQRQGIVDAVMTEDVDAIMFGSTCTLRNWAAEGKSQKTPTHVDVYNVKDGNINGYTREGLVLIAMMSGGDYLPDGIKGCGVKVAGEAALAGFGKELCRLKRTDTEGRKAWKASLLHELSTNENKYFRVKHKALSSVVTEEFPNMDVLRYYTRPVVSPLDALEPLRGKVHQEPQLRLNELREFTRQTFGWDYRIGAEKFIKVLGDALLARKMLYRPEEATAAIKKISTRREHFSTDAEPELRLSYVPEEIVPINISEEQNETVAFSRGGLALNDDEDPEALEVEAETEANPSSQPKPFDVTQPVPCWALEEFTRRMVPDMVADWEDAKKSKKLKSPRKKKKGEEACSGMPRGAIDKFFSVTKKTSVTAKLVEKSTLNIEERRPIQKPTRIKSPPVFNIPSSLPSSPSREPSKQSEPPNSNDGNDTRSSRETPSRSRPAKATQEPIVITSSPIAAPSSPSPRSGRSQPSALGSSQVSGTIRSGFATITASQGVTSKPTKQRTTKPAAPKKTVQSTAKSGTKYKQMSMYMFTQRSEPSTSQVCASSQVSATAGLDDPFDSSDDELPPLSSMTSATKSPVRKFPVPQGTGSPGIVQEARRQRQSPDHLSSEDEFHSFHSSSPFATNSPKSPGKRLKSPSDSEREPKDPTTPTKASKSKKKLLAPRNSAVGYYKEIEVEASKRDEMIKEIERTHGKGTVARVSDVSLIDLTQDG